MIKNLFKKVFIAAALLFAAFIILKSFLYNSFMSSESECNAFYFDTPINIKINAKKSKALLDGCLDICARLEMTLSATNPESELFKLNESNESVAEVSDDLRDCIECALKYSKLSGGRFDLTIRPVSSLWDFHTENPSLPDKIDIDDALKYVDYSRVHLSGNVITFDSPGIKLELGGVAKGYISGKLADYLEKNGCRSALINLGGNVRAVGLKQNKSRWNIGIQKPYSPRGEIITTVEAEDVCVISSGTYERYFEYNGIKYHHILDPDTGYPADTDYSQITVIGQNDADCDALATIALISGPDEALRIAYEADCEISILTVDNKGILKGPLY